MPVYKRGRGTAITTSGCVECATEDQFPRRARRRMQNKRRARSSKTSSKVGTARETRVRAPASVNREFELLSRVYNLAIQVGKADSNPCQRVKKFKLDNERYRFLTPTEEADLMIWLVGLRDHLEPMVIVALGLGLRKQEQLKLRRDQVDFFRNVVVASRTKGKRNREIPMDVLDDRVKPISGSFARIRRPMISSLLILKPKSLTRM